MKVTWPIIENEGKILFDQHFRRDMKEINENYKTVIKCDKSQNLCFIAEAGRETQYFHRF